MNGRHHDLPVWETTRDSWLFLAKNLRHLPGIALFPALLFLALIRLQMNLDLQGWAALALGLPHIAMHAIPATMVAVPWYRAALSAPVQPAGAAIPAWYYVRFLQRWFLVEMITFVPLMPVQAIAVALDIEPDAADPRNASILLLTVMVVGATAWPYARCSLALPAAAIGSDCTFAEAWRLTAGNGWRVVGSLLLCSTPLVLAALVVLRYFPQEPSPAQAFVLSCLGAAYYLFAELLSASVLAQIYMRLKGGAYGGGRALV